MVRPWRLLAAAGLAYACAVALPARAAEGSPELAACMDAVDPGGLKNSQWTACLEAEAARQDRRLNAEYRRLQAVVAQQDGAEASRALVAGQRAWLAFRTAWCAFEGARESVAPGGMVNRAACMAETTRRQADVLAAGAQ